MTDYVSMLNDLAQSNSNSIISSVDEHHAAILIVKLFEIADQTVTIFAGPQDEYIYTSPEVVHAAARFLQTASAKLNFIFEDLEKSSVTQKISNPFLEQLHHSIGASVASKIAIYPADMQAKNLLYHFILVDDKAFRFEPDKMTREAFATFNNTAAAACIKTVVDRMLLRIAPIAHFELTQ
ncbi:MAG: hypothetical protein ACTS9Y_09335 [Methylophilus sp.]|uniref:hypothetical protein n=1 Tax=Methylophilus sp. TaxID=29541 RepID=UPI003FA07FDF